MNGLPSKLLQRGLNVEYISLAWVSVACFVAVSAGVMASSLALLAFGGDSIIDMISSWTVLSHLRRTEKAGGIDEENKTANRIKTILTFLLVPTIIIGIVYSYLRGVAAEPSALGIGMVIGSVVIMPILAVEKNRIGSKGNLVQLSIDAMESWMCFFMSLALLGGLVMNYLWGIWWADYFAALIILVFIMSRALVSLQETKT